MNLYLRVRSKYSFSGINLVWTSKISGFFSACKIISVLIGFVGDIGGTKTLDMEALE
jgi:hypothetical protein